MKDIYLLVAEKGIGYISKEQSEELPVFECRCSKNNVKVFHNAFGRHIHITEERLNQIIYDLEKLGYKSY